MNKERYKYTYEHKKYIPGESSQQLSENNFFEIINIYLKTDILEPEN